MKKLFEKLLADLVSQQLISEEHVSNYTEMFESASEQMREHALTEAMKRVDDDHSEKLERVIEAIDIEHTTKIEQIIEMYTNLMNSKVTQVTESIDADHAKKLESVVEMYESFKDAKLTKSVSEYLDTYLEEVTPTEQVIDAVKMQRLETAFESIKDILVVNDDYVQTEVREAVLEGNEMLELRDHEIDKIMMEKIQLQQKLNKLEAVSLLETKLKGTSPKMKAYLESKFEYSSVSDIEESFDEAIEVYEAEESDLRDKLIKEESKNKTNPITKKLEEQFEDKTNQPSNLMESYVANMQKYKPRT